MLVPNLEKTGHLIRKLQRNTQAFTLYGDNVTYLFLYKEAKETHNEDIEKRSQTLFLGYF
jgi:hypothetical protein